MATQIQFRRGTKTQHNSFTGATAEVTVNTTDKSLHVHDGTTQGGFELARANLSNHNGVGVLTATTFSGNVTGNLTGNINSSGISTLNNVVVGGATTALVVNGNARVTGILTVGTSSLTLDGINDRITVGTGLTITSTQITIGSITIGSGSLTGTATSTTNIPNLTGAITSVNTTTSLGSFTSANLATALTDETGTGVAVFATSPTLVTPVLGAASATSINVTGVTTSSSGFVGALTGLASSATQLATGRTIAITGDLTYTSPSFNGSGNVTAAGTLATVNANVGSFGGTGTGTTITVNAKGLITGITTFAASAGGLTLTDDTSTNASRFLTFTSATSGSISAANVSSTKLIYNPSTGSLSATDFNSTSDISLKDNIQTIVNPLDKIIKLNGVTFNWKENQKPSIGVIAQELEKVLPELVTQGDVKSVNYNGLIGLLIEAIKEQQKQIEELKNLVKDLTST